jgi:hypothetical protein
MRQPWSKTNVDGASFRNSDGELDRLYDEMPSLPEPPAQAEGSGSAADSGPPRSQQQAIAPPEEATEEATECANPSCADAFQEAAESGAPLVEGSSSGCTDRREVDDAAKRPDPDRRKNA